MARVSIYLNFQRKTEEAFNFYRQVFGVEFATDIQRMGEVPGATEAGMAEEDKNLVMHVALPILGGTLLMGTDVPEDRGTVSFGNNIHINLEPDTKEETDKLFQALSEGGTVKTPLQTMFWGDYFGSLTDKFGVNWMFNCSSKDSS